MSASFPFRSHLFTQRPRFWTKRRYRATHSLLYLLSLRFCSPCKFFYSAKHNSNTIQLLSGGKRLAKKKQSANKQLTIKHRLLCSSQEISSSQVMARHEHDLPSFWMICVAAIDEMVTNTQNTNRSGFIFRPCRSKIQYTSD